MALDPTRRARALRSARLYVPAMLLRRGLPAEERARWQDLRAFRRRYGDVLCAPAPPRDGPSLLVPHLDAPAFVTQIHGLFGRACAQRGARPLYVTFRDDIWSEEYLRLYGHREFVYVDDYVSPLAQHEQRARELVAGCESLDDVLSLRLGEAEVGRPAASRLLKDLRLGSLDLSDDGVRSGLERTLAASTWYAEAAARLLADVRPDKLLSHEAYSYTPSAQFFHAALLQGVDTLHWMRSPTEHSLLFRRYDLEHRHEHFFTLTDETWAEVGRAPWTAEDGESLRRRLRSMYLDGRWFVRKDMLRDKRVKSRDEILGELGLDPSKRTAVIFSHVLYDATFWFGTSLFPDYAAWLVETIRRACANDRVNWIVKMHPENVTRTRSLGETYDAAELEEYQVIRRHFPELPPHVALMLPENDTNPLSLFDAADWGLTVRGTVGLELPCFGTPVLTAGTGGYSGRGFTHDSETVERYLDRIDRIDEIPPLDEEATALAQRFTNAVFFLKPVPLESFRWRVVWGGEYERDPFVFELLAGSPEELARAGDLSAFAAWALATTKGDLIRPYQRDELPEMPAAVPAAEEPVGMR
jgi:hypothetical protein